MIEWRKAIREVGGAVMIKPQTSTTACDQARSRKRSFTKVGNGVVGPAMSRSTLVEGPKAYPVPRIDVKRWSAARTTSRGEAVAATSAWTASSRA